jgi:hypothetical protein
LRRLTRRYLDAYKHRDGHRYIDRYEYARVAYM